MSVKVMSAVWDNGPADATQRFVLLALADNASDDGGNAYPSIATIAQKCAMSERTVIRALAALVKDGYLERRRRKDISNMYQIVIARLVGDRLSPAVSDNLSPTQVTQCHPVSDNMTLEVSDTVSPDPSSYNHPYNHPRGERQNGDTAPAPALSPIPFQPVPETVRRQKAQRGIVEPEPDVTATAPPAVALLHRLTNYWPGADISPALAERLGNAPDEAALAHAVELWRLSGNKPTNWLGIIDWYDQLRADPAWTPQARFKANGRAQPAPTVSTPAPGSQPVTW